jgi:hypothetical protein
MAMADCGMRIARNRKMGMWKAGKRERKRTGRREGGESGTQEIRKKRRGMVTEGTERQRRSQRRNVRIWEAGT